MSKVIALYHIVFSTYLRQMTIPEESKRELYGYLFGILRNIGCKVWRINGIGNHVHLLISLPSSVSLATVVQKLKQNSSIWLKENPKFPKFRGWSKEYFAGTIAEKDKQGVINYITNQEAHHLRNQSIEAEFDWEDNGCG